MPERAGTAARDALTMVGSLIVASAIAFTIDRFDTSQVQLALTIVAVALLVVTAAAAARLTLLD